LKKYLVLPLIAGYSKEDSGKLSGFLLVETQDPIDFVMKEYERIPDKDKNKEIIEHIKKVRSGEIILCRLAWNEEGPAKGNKWMFTCDSDTCDKNSECKIQLITRSDDPKKLIIDKDHDSVEGTPKECTDYIHLIFCECKKKKS
jgi:hypothetical protein